MHLLAWIMSHIQYIVWTVSLIQKKEVAEVIYTAFSCDLNFCNTLFCFCMQANTKKSWASSKSSQNLKLLLPLVDGMKDLGNILTWPVHLKTAKLSLTVSWFLSSKS